MDAAGQTLSDDTDLVAAWLSEAAATTDPDDPTIAWLETEAADRGLDLVLIASALLAAPRRDDDFEEEAHPRDAVGRFLKKDGEVKVGKVTVPGQGGKQIDLTGRRGKILGIDKDPNGKVRVRVAILNPDGSQAMTVNLSPKQMRASTEKARLNLPGRRDRPGREQRRENRADRFRDKEQSWDKRIKRKPSPALLRWARATGWNPERESLDEWHDERREVVEKRAKEQGWDGKEPIGLFRTRRAHDRAKKRGWDSKSQSFEDWQQSIAAQQGWNPRKEDYQEWRIRQVAKAAGRPSHVSGQVTRAIKQGWNPKQETLGEYRRRRAERKDERDQARDDRELRRQSAPPQINRRRGESWDDFRERRDESRERYRRQQRERRERDERARLSSGAGTEDSMNPDELDGLRARVHSSRIPAHTDLVASLRSRVHGRALTAAFDPDLHPRGRDGQFIEKLGIVQLFGVTDREGRFGKKKDLSGQRAKVVDIKPDRDSPGNPDIEVAILDENGQPGKKITVKKDHLGAAPEKARIGEPGPDTEPAAPSKTADELWEMSADDLDGELERLEAEGKDYRDPDHQLVTKIRNNKVNAARPAPAPAAPEDAAKAAAKSLTDLADSPDVRKASDLQRVQGTFGQSYVRAVNEARDALASADASNVGQRADDLVRALERLRDDLRSQSGSPGSTIGQEFRGIEMSSDRITIEALSRAVEEARRRAFTAKSVRASAADTRRMELRARVHPPFSPPPRVQG